MSVLPAQSWITPNNPFFLLANVSTLTANNIETSNLACINLSTGQATVSSIKGTEGGVNIDFAFISSLNSDGKIEATEFSSIFTYAQEGTVSTLFTQHIILDSATLDVVNGDVLLLNGIPLATTSTSISSLQDWSFYPALQAVDMNTFNLSNVGNINSQNIFNALNIQSDTYSALTSLTSPAGTITNLRATGLSTNTFQVNTVQNGGNTSWLSPLTVSSLAVSSLTTNPLTAPVVIGDGLSSLTVSTGSVVAATFNGQPLISGSNWSSYPATGNVQLAGNQMNTTGNFSFNAASNTFFSGQDFSITADGGLAIASITEIGMIAQNGNRGRINMIANSGNNNGVAGEIFLTANGGQVAGVGTGGTIELTANTPLGFSNLTSKITLNASGINSYAGSVPALASAYGYNFIYGQNGVYIASGLPPGLPNTPGTTYIYGTLGIEMPSDAYMKNIYPYWDGLTTPPDLNIEGRYIIPNLAQVCVNLSNVRNLDFQSNVATRITNIDSISMSNGAISGVNTINGAAYPPPTSGVLPAQLVSTVGGLGSAGYISSLGSFAQTNRFSTLFTSTFAFSTATSVGSNTLFNYPILIDYDQAGNTSNAGVAIAVQGHNFGTGAVINRIEMGARATGENYIMSLWPGQNLEELVIDATDVSVRDSDGFSTIINLNPYGLTTNGIIQSPSVSTTQILCSTINGVQLPSAYGSFSGNATQTVSAANTATEALFDTTEIASGMTLSGSSNFVSVDRTGVYKVFASPQFATTSGGVNVADFWLLLNLSNVPRTNSQMTVANNGQVFSGIEWIVSCASNDRIGVGFGSPDSNMALTYYAASGYAPETPAIILNITQIS